MDKLVYIALAVLIGVAFFVGRGCRDDSETQRRLDAARDSVRALDAQIETLAARELVLQDSIAHTLVRLEESDFQRRASSWHREQAEAALKTVPRYDTLSNDALAVHADSVYRAQSVRHADPD